VHARLIEAPRRPRHRPEIVDVRQLIGGYFFPRRQEAFIDGKLVVLIAVRSIQVNTNPPDALFDPEALRREH